MSYSEIDFPSVFSLNNSREPENNCLFDAAVCAGEIVSTETMEPFDSQELRELCENVLRSEDMPVFPKGEPAGDQYIQSLSKLLHCAISVFTTGDPSLKHVADVVHSDVNKLYPDGNLTKIEIVHSGDVENGHWESKTIYE